MISAIKLDLTLTPYDIEGHTVRFAKFRDGYEIPLNVENASKISPCIPYDEEIFQCVRLNKIEDGRKIEKNYLVKVDQRGLFEELIEITNCMIESRVGKEIEKKLLKGQFVTREHYEDMRRMTERQTIAYIHGLPWWKRLFNLV